MSEAVSSNRRRYFSVRTLTFAYAIVLLLLLAAMEWRSESFLLLGILSFAPSVLLLLPLVILVPWALWRRQWLALGLHVVCVLVVLFVFMSFRFGAKSVPEGAVVLTAITHNIGQTSSDAFDNSFPTAKPDVILLQDVAAGRGREQDYRHRYPGLKEVTMGQFVLLTPYPVESSRYVDEAEWNHRPIAARFVVNFKGRKIAVYTVHLPTPRRSLAHVVSPRALSEIFWLDHAPTDGFPSYRAWLNARVELARDLAAVFDKETLPFIVGGDFNMPDHGILYHTFASRLTDAHATAGRGWGLTFPGAREGGLAGLVGAWLRLDYWFCGPGWRPIECRVAADEHSQHRAVLARFVLKP
jgi:endonuclease/exonuclease/phosphatase (EEP) superfamily protein YafD